MNTYTWNFPAFDCYPQYESQTDVVFTIHWSLSADDGNGHVASVYNTQAVTYTAGSPFTPYSQLQPAQVQAWVEEAMGPELVAATKLNLDNQIEQQINPSQVTLPAPWATVAPEEASA